MRKLLAPWPAGDADPAGNPEHHLEAAGFDARLLLFGLTHLGLVGALERAIAILRAAARRRRRRRCQRLSICAIGRGGGGGAG